MSNKPFEYLLVTVQFSTLAYLFLATNWVMMPVWALAGLAISFLLAVWAIGIMQFSNLKVTPSPGESAQLRMNGPYKLIRHPMYSSLLIAALFLIIPQYSLLRLITGLLLTIDLIVKLNYEEKLLQQKFNTYRAYIEKTYRLIPFIY